MKKLKTYTPRPNWLGWTKWIVLQEEEVFSCCDCGLAHTVKLKSEKGKVYWKAKRNKVQTKENRQGNIK